MEENKRFDSMQAITSDLFRARLISNEDWKWIANNRDYAAKLMAAAIKNRPIFSDIGMKSIPEKNEKYLVGEKVEYLSNKYPERKIAVTKEFKERFFSTKIETPLFEKKVCWYELELDQYGWDKITEKTDARKAQLKIAEIMHLLEEELSGKSIFSENGQCVFFLLDEIAICFGRCRDWNSGEEFFQIAAKKIDSPSFFVREKSRIFSDNAHAL